MALAGSTRVIVLTSSMRRHAYVANAIAARLTVLGVWCEEKSFQPIRYARNADDERVIQEHFAARDASEHDFFREHDEVRAPVRRVTARGCNDPLEIDRMRGLDPDAVLVFGTSLLEQPLIDAFPGRILNIHLGLSPYYRGAGTNFWPLVNGEPEYCGATIHFLDTGIDTGPIVAHVRPEIRAGDGPHDIGNRTIVAAAEELTAAAEAHVRHPFVGIRQTGGGRLYRRADFSADAVRRLYDNFRSGMIERYLRERSERDVKLSLISRQGVTAR